MADLPAPAATAAHALLASLVRHVLVGAGSALVTRGIVDQGAVDGFVATMVETIVGTLMVAGATGWAQARAWLSHTRWAAAWAALNGEVAPPFVEAATGQLPPPPRPTDAAPPTRPTR